MADTKISALTALAQADLDSTNDVVPIVDTGAGETKKMTPRLLVGGTVNNLIQTWNDAGTTFSGVKLNVTDTTSNAASLLIDLQAGASSQFKVSKAGAVTAVGAVACAALNPTGDITLADAKNIVVNATTGTKIGTATNQKLAFYNSAPLAQQALTVDLLDAVQALGLVASGAGNTPLNLTAGAFACGTVGCATITLADAADVVVNTSTGTKIGTATTQKLAFFNSTPIVQPVNTVAIDTALVNLGLRATGGVANFATVVTQPGTFGGIYIYDGAAAQTVATATQSVLTSFAAAGGADGLSSDVTVAKASNKITVTRAGKYRVSYSISYSSSVSSSVWEFYVFNNGTQINSTGAQSKTATAADIQCVSGCGFTTVAANTDLDIRGSHGEGGNANITINHANFTVEYVGA